MMNEFWLKKMPRDRAYKLTETMRNFVINEINLMEYFEENNSNDYKVEPEVVEIDFEGVSNGFLAHVIHAITRYQVEVIGEVEVLFPCPCCGYKSLTEIYDSEEGTGYDICAYCKWEDDGTTGINSKRSINRGSIQDYRNRIHANFNRFYIDKWLKE